MPTQLVNGACITEDVVISSLVLLGDCKLLEGRDYVILILISPLCSIVHRSY